ncbi:MAG: pseudouridine synthase [Myxococcota bacterium]|nr:pseudouridine synthase [Myxococcota bacterium]
MAEMRLARAISRSGLASRREAERWIREGKVVLNGHVETDVATKVDPDSDHIKVDGKPLPKEPPRVYYAFYKPKGCITSRDDPQERKSVYDLVGDLGVRVEAVGRLDFDTEGLLLLTNDGDLAAALTHPRYEVPKRYTAKIWRIPTDATIDRIQKGVFLPDGKTAPAKMRVTEATQGGNCWVEITVTEGRNRLVRRIFEAMNHPVAKLRRESFATIGLKGLERGDVRPLTSDEIRRLKEIAKGKRPQLSGKFKYKKGFAKPKPKAKRIGRKNSRDKGSGPVKRRGR